MASSLRSPLYQPTYPPKVGRYICLRRKRDTAPNIHSRGNPFLMFLAGRAGCFLEFLAIDMLVRIVSCRTILYYTVLYYAMLCYCTLWYAVVYPDVMASNVSTFSFTMLREVVAEERDHKVSLKDEGRKARLCRCLYVDADVDVYE